jgi:hypothetical protein
MKNFFSAILLLVMRQTPRYRPTKISLFKREILMRPSPRLISRLGAIVSFGLAFGNAWAADFPATLVEPSSGYTFSALATASICVRRRPSC